MTAPTPYPYFVLGGFIGLLTGVLLWWSKPPLSLSLNLACLSGLIAWVVPSTLNSVDRHLSLVFAANLCLGLVAFTLAACCRDRRGWAFIVVALCLGLLLNSSLGLGELVEGGQLRANFTNPDCYSILPLGLFFLCLGLYSPSRRKQTLLSFVGAASMAMILALTSCRASFLGMLVGLVFLGLVSWREPEFRPMVKAGLFLPLLGMTLLLALGQVSKVTQKWQRLINSRDPGGVKTRVDVMIHGPQATLERPLYGFGPGTFHLAYQTDRPEQLLVEEFMNVAHNDFVQVWVDLGFPGLILFLLFCLSPYRRILGTHRLRAVDVAAASGWLAMLVYLNLNFALPVAACSAWLFAFAGLLEARLGSRAAPDQRVRIWMTLVLMAASVHLLYQGNLGREVKESTLRSQQYSADLDWQQAYRALEPALSRQPYNKELLIERSRLALRLGILLNDPVWTERAISELEKARRLSPLDVELVARLARVLERSGELKRAEALWHDGLEIAPTNWRLRRDLVRNLLLQGQTEQALAEMKSIGPVRYPAVYGELLAILELSKPKLGQQAYRELLAQEAPEVARGVTQSLNRTAKELRSSQLQRVFLELYLERFPADLCLRLDYLEALPSEGKDPNYDNELLKIANEETDEDSTRACINKALRLWAARRIARQESLDEVLLLLNRRLRDQPHQIEIRLLTSQAYRAKGEPAPARAVLREGLDFDPKGTLHAALGALFLEGDHLETAESYYLEALKRSPNTRSWRQRLQAIQEKLAE